MQKKTKLMIILCLSTIVNLSQADTVLHFDNNLISSMQDSKIGEGFTIEYEDTHKIGYGTECIKYADLSKGVTLKSPHNIIAVFGISCPNSKYYWVTGNEDTNLWLNCFNNKCPQINQSNVIEKSGSGLPPQ